MSAGVRERASENQSHCVHAIIQNLLRRIVAFILYGFIKVIWVRTGIHLNILQLDLNVCFLTLFEMKRNWYKKWKKLLMYTEMRVKGWKPGELQFSSFSCRICKQWAPGVRGLVAVWGWFAYWLAPPPEEQTWTPSLYLFQSGKKDNLQRSN